MKSTWRQRADRVLGAALATAEAERPGDLAHALAAGYTRATVVEAAS